MAATQGSPTPVFHYNCRRCGVLVAQEGDRWIGQGGGTTCERYHLPNGKFTNGTRNTVCRYCDEPLEWADLAWRSERTPHTYTCDFKHQV